MDFLRINKSILCACLVFLASCGGGGTAGSGVVNTEKIRVEGTVEDSEGKPISNAMIEVVGDIQTYQSDEQGKFVFETDKDKKEIVVNVTKDGAKSQLSVALEPDQNDTASLAIILDDEGNFVVGTPTLGTRCPGPPLDEEAVCGVDGKDYPSRCVALSLGIAVDYPTKCNLLKDCPTDDVCDGLVDCGNTKAVCGKDNKTYSSAAVAHSRGIGVAYHRACIDVSALDRDNSCSLVCVGPPLESDKVCGMDGITYLSECLAVKSGVNVAFSGSCDAAESCNPDPVCGVYTTCPANAQVCGKDGSTYTNEAAATSAGVGVAYHRSCLEYSQVTECSFTCLGPPPIEAQVCGVDGQTYASECAAMVFFGVQTAHPGAC